MDAERAKKIVEQVEEDGEKAVEILEKAMAKSEPPERIERWMATWDEGGAPDYYSVTRGTAESRSTARAGGRVVRLVELRDGEQIVLGGHWTAGGVLALAAERDALRAEVGEAKVRVTAMEQQLIAQSAVYEAEVERLRENFDYVSSQYTESIKSNLRNPRIPHGPDLLALGAQVGDWACLIWDSGRETRCGRIVSIADGRATLQRANHVSPFTLVAATEHGEWFILRKGGGDATATRPAGGAEAQAGAAAESVRQVEHGGSAELLRETASRPERAGEKEGRSVVGGVLVDSREHDGDAPSHEPGCASLAAVPYCSVKCDCRESRNGSHEPGCASWQPVDSLTGRREPCDCRESRRVDGVIHQPGCQMVGPSRCAAEGEEPDCTCLPEPGSVHRDIRRLKPQRGDDVSPNCEAEIALRFSRMAGPHYWLCQQCLIEHVAVTADGWRLVSRATPVASSERKAADDELPEAERRDLERRRDAWLVAQTAAGPRNVMIHDILNGVHCLSRMIHGTDMYTTMGSGPTYHHALRAALAAHEQEASK